MMKESGGEKCREREIHAHRSEIRSYCPPHLPLPFTISISQLHSPTRPEEIPCVPSREGAKTHKALKPISLSLLSCPQNLVATLETNRRKRKSLRSQNCITAIKKGVQRQLLHPKMNYKLIAKQEQNVKKSSC